MIINEELAKEFKVKQEQIDNTVTLIDDGKTIPFISRYRKEATGNLDDQLLREIYDRLLYLRNLENRKKEVFDSIEALGFMTEEIAKSLTEAVALSDLEDIYRPYKPKRKTRASVAREKGLQGLADFIMEQTLKSPTEEAKGYISEEKGVTTTEEAIAGAMDIIAETISDDPAIRHKLVEHYYKWAMIVSKAVDPLKESVYTNYYDYKEGISKIPTHRILAIDRGEREEILKVSIETPVDAVLGIIKSSYYKGNNDNGKLVISAIEDSLKRLIHPSVERRIRGELTEKSCTAAIKLFSDNLRQLLMQPPLKGTVTLGLDPAYRTGCKIAVIDDMGKPLATTVIYPTPPQSKIEQSMTELKILIKKYGVTTIAIGNGTASHESEVFIAELIKELDVPVTYMVVSEAGASVYSASKLAADEFPDYDVTQRSAVSIARRLQDPLAELVKIDPMAIGVGQYQHDMPKAELKNALGGVVEGCVNKVGVDLNTASHTLLSFVSGVNATVAKNIIAYRNENGAFKTRKELLKVSKLGAKAFEQCAGFLRVEGGENPLDGTAVHPESYKPAAKLLDLCGYTIKDIAAKTANDLKARATEKGIGALATEVGVGEPTLRDIIDELIKPGRDPREELPKPLLRTDVLDINSLTEGMILTGTVRNVIDFGVFVDVGVHQDGLVHISQLSDRRVNHPLDVVKVGDIVKVKVMSVDVPKKRIALTMKGVG